MTRITMPVRQEGVYETLFGAQPVTFKDGVAEVDFEINDGLLAYLLRTGYGVDDIDPVQPAPAPEPVDPRDHGRELIGTPLRDAAVDPQPGDFLAPTNAGEANPHGPQVVSPGIHGIGPGPIVPGTVGSPDYQQEKESQAAELVMVDGESVGKVTAALNAVARAEYAKTQAKGKRAGTAQELTEDDTVDTSHLTAEERDLLGLDPTEEDAPDSEDELKGEALDAKLEELELSKAGTADEKRDRVRIAQTPAEDLKGADLETALREADLPLSGSADERRARVQEFRDGQSV